MRLANAGFGVYGIDNQGHGKSQGILGYIPSFDDLVDDCSQFFTSICGKFYLLYFEKKKMFLRLYFYF